MRDRLIAGHRYVAVQWSGVEEGFLHLTQAFEAVLRNSCRVAHAGRIQELIDAGSAALKAADYSRVERIGNELLAVAGEDETALARGYNLIGNARLQVGDGDGADAMYRKALELFRKSGDEAWVATVLMNLGIVAIEIHMDIVEGRRLYDMTLPMMRQHGSPFMLALALGNFAEISRLEGDYTQSLAYAEESIQLFETLGETGWAAWRRTTVAHVRSLRREYQAAIDILSHAYAGIAGGENPHWQAVYFDVWFLLAVELKRYESAARIAGFCDRFRLQRNVPRLGSLMPWFVPSLERVRKSMSEERYSGLRSEGAHYTQREAQAETEMIAL